MIKIKCIKTNNVYKIYDECFIYFFGWKINHGFGCIGKIVYNDIRKEYTFTPVSSVTNIRSDTLRNIYHKITELNINIKND